MKFPVSWLSEHVTITATPEALAERMTAIGLEVEEMTHLGVGLDGVVVARILECSRHPDAERLQVCRVDVGVAEPVQIVCGAPNARAGLRAPLAMIGACLPGEVRIKAVKLRGVESQGMLCSARELGLDADAAGLLELPADAPVGTPLAEYLGLPDTSYEIKLTPNRADCFGVRGIAYDVAAALGVEVKPFVCAPIVVESGAEVVVTVDAPTACPRYCGRVIEGVDARAPSPLWMRERLRRSGVRPISLLVDVTQYVMLELGQPMHAFDRDRLRGPIGVRMARPGESLTLLDGRTVSVDPEFLLITDADRPIALAGVMGGSDSRVSEDTRSVFLESAHFVPEAIIGRARKLGMHTDASHRFERGVDPELPRLALDYATRLILDIAGGRAGPVVEVASERPAVAPVGLRRARLARVLGCPVADAEVERILRALGMQVEASTEGWQVRPPSRRFDITIEEDLIEEVVRIHGYEAVPTSLPSGRFPLHVPSAGRVPDDDLRRHLRARDYHEAVCMAFLDAATLAHWQDDAAPITLANPLSEELAVMRPLLLPGLSTALARNLDRQQTRVRLFEIGRVFTRGEDGLPVETRRIAAVACGSAAAEQWGAPSRAMDFFDLKGDLESLLHLGRVGHDWLPASVPWLHPGRGAELRRGSQLLGWAGALHPALLKALAIDTEVWAFELDLDVLSRAEPARAVPLSRFPAVRRDLAVVVREDTAWATVAASVRAAVGPILADLRLFDEYRGGTLESGTKSLAMGLILQDVSRTLTDQDADRAVADAVAALARDCAASIRG